MSNKTITITHLGKEYKGEVAKISKTYFGNGENSRGVMSTWLYCDWQDGGGIGVGGYALDEYEESSKRRIGTAQGLDFILNILDTAGVESWEQLIGLNIIVLFEGTGSSIGYQAVGFAGLENDKVFLHKEFNEYWKARDLDK